MKVFIFGAMSDINTDCLFYISFNCFIDQYIYVAFYLVYFLSAE